MIIYDNLINNEGSYNTKVNMKDDDKYMVIVHLLNKNYGLTMVLMVMVKKLKHLSYCDYQIKYMDKQFKNMAMIDDEWIT